MKGRRETRKEAKRQKKEDARKGIRERDESVGLRKRSKRKEEWEMKQKRCDVRYERMRKRS